MNDLQKYFEMSDAELDEITSTRIDDPNQTKTYMFEVGDMAGDVKVWDSGQTQISLKTIVAEGEYKGRGGPLLRLSLGAYIGQNESPTEAEIEERVGKSAARFAKVVKAVTDGAAIALPDGDFEAVMRSVADTLEGQRFIGVVAKRDDSGFAKFAPQGIHSVSNPPNSYKPEVEAFSL